ncbi:MAG: hypothetical protein K2X71_25530 [Methylobacterium sp.]|uniref:hypothetical protein n=1 Tax=Methylobacterium sp. TaxID=409 RepID=UPI002587234D|nr:hypothetical protein [Methylobacterium sp.]MBY0299360.1 hypothetical protein [Methylobacterium sp.]
MESNFFRKPNNSFFVQKDEEASTRTVKLMMFEISEAIPLVGAIDAVVATTIGTARSVHPARRDRSAAAASRIPHFGKILHSARGR